MYFAIVVGCFVVFPIVSIIIDLARRRRGSKEPETLLVVVRWFTFWIVGVRLFIAGAMQALVPEYTAETIFATSDAAVLPFISELGFANLAFGAIGIVSLFRPSWILPAATAGTIFLGLDGIRHALAGGAFTFDRMIAMTTDLIALIMLGAGAIALALRGRQSRTLRH